jgi:hypothetical protein
MKTSALDRVWSGSGDSAKRLARSLKVREPTTTEKALSSLTPTGSGTVPESLFGPECAVILGRRSVTFTTPA